MTKREPIVNFQLNRNSLYVHGARSSLCNVNAQMNAESHHKRATIAHHLHPFAAARIEVVQRRAEVALVQLMVVVVVVALRCRRDAAAVDTLQFLTGETRFAVSVRADDGRCDCAERDE